MSDEPYHNKGFGVAFIAIIFGTLILPTIILFITLGTWVIYQVGRYLKV